MSMNIHKLIGLIVLLGWMSSTAVGAEERTLKIPAGKPLQLRQLPAPTADPLAVQKQANAKAANEVRASMQEIIRFQGSTWQGERVCEDSRLRWKTATYAGATKVPKDIWDCAPFACDAGRGTCKASCDRTANSCAAGAECVMTDADGRNGVCVNKD